MFRSLQIKIIVIIAILAIIVFAIPGIIYLNYLSSLNDPNMINDTIELGKKIFLILSISFVIISTVIIIFSSKIILRPITKLIKSATLIADESGLEQKEIKYVKDKKAKSDVDELYNAFNMVTDSLKENLNEVTRQKKQIETILLHMTDGIIAFNIDGNIIHINPAASRLLRLSKEDNTFDKIFKKLNVDINMEKIIYLESWTSTEEKVSIDDAYLSMYFAPYKDENERPAGVMVLVQDITEHVRLDNMRKEFVADVSHELKTPLTSILGYSETLAENDYDEEIRHKFLNVISTEAIRMTKLVNDLLTLSKFDSNMESLEKEEFDLGELVKQCVQNLQIEMDRKNQKIECFVTANVPNVYADKDGIERVVLNILSNSVKYTEAGGTIKIYVGFVYNDAYIKIIDNGLRNSRRRFKQNI